MESSSPIKVASLSTQKYMSIDQESLESSSEGLTPTTGSTLGNPNLIGSFILCLLVGPLNFVLYKVMYAAYGDSRAFFVSQGVNFLYVVYGGIILWYLSKKGEITAETRNISHKKFIVMGLLDCIGGFLGAMGANGTSGSLQQLLNQTLIPITMLLSWMFLNHHSSVMQIAGATLIMGGAWIVISSSVGDGPVSNNYSAISILIYFCSNIPIAFSSVYKEMNFNDVHMHVMYMTQWVSVYQFIFGFAAGLLQTIPGMGSLNGSSLNDIVTSFWSGFGCFFHTDELCAQRSAFWLLTGYCVVNFVFNIVGLVIVKYESATLNTITNALILPLTVLAFNLPFLGEFKETSGMETWVGLAVVLVGFAIWKLSAAPVGATTSSNGSPSKPKARSRSTSLQEGGSSGRVEGFSDRVIFLSLEQAVGDEDED